MKKIYTSLLLIASIAIITSCGKQKNKENTTDPKNNVEISDEALLDSVQRRTFLYFWDGAEPNSGMARERYHVDGDYGKYNKSTVTSGGSGFGIMAILVRVLHSHGLFRQ